ncbi:hypothetical protein BB561_000695 [Smittium simulii]|uniref:C3H1-type domain-containing protein n=1 Tax=Smittium simulii TaxID=133385 RepID=A0A2T9YXX2_9FUNG|nr:hypothetical protein BB561_000695 [Smittium simulii]
MSEFINYNTITRHNIAKLSVLIKQLISNATFISIDTEFTGLKLEQVSSEFAFDFRKWNNRNSQRYKALRLLVSTHALVSIGLSIYQAVPQEPLASHTFTVNNFNFILQRENSHMISPSSISFLAQNGYDFNLQATSGIRFLAPPLKPSLQPDLSSPRSLNASSVENQFSPTKDTPKRKRESLNNKSTPNKKAASGSLSNTKRAENLDGKILRDIILSAIRSEASLVVHNGLLDLLFIYYSFVADLPETIDSFIADFCHLLCGSIYDTKVIGEYDTRDEATFLSYLYHKRKREMLKREKSNLNSIIVNVCKEINLPHISAHTNSTLSGNQLNLTPSSAQSLAGLSNNKNAHKNPLPYCKQFASHGYCNSGNDCPLSHDLEFIFNYRDADKNQQKQMRDDFFTSPDDVSNGQSLLHSSDNKTDSLPKTFSKAQSPNSPAKTSDKNQLLEAPQSMSYHSAVLDAHMTGYIYASTALNINLDTSKNKIYLIGKDFPLTIQASKFSKNSQEYLDFIKTGF